MTTHTQMPDDRRKSERAAVALVVVGSPGAISGDPYPGRPPREIPPLACPICGTALRGRQTSACSDKCRAALSRRKRIPVKAEEFRNVRALLKTTLESLWEAKATLEKYGGG